MKGQKAGKALRKQDVVRIIVRRRNYALCILAVWTAVLALGFFAMNNQLGSDYPSSRVIAGVIVVILWAMISPYYFVNLVYSRSLSKGYRQWNRVLYIYLMAPFGVIMEISGFVSDSYGTNVASFKSADRAFRSARQARLVDKYFS